MTAARPGGSVARRTVRRLIPVALPLAGLALFAALAAFAVPQADDFCYAAAARAEGLAGGVLEVYRDWSGRIVASLLIMLPAAVADAAGADLVTAYRWASVALIALAAVPAVVAARRLWPGAGGAAAAAIGLTLLYCLIANARSPRDLFYWLPGAATYAVPGLLAALVLVVLLTAAAGRRRLSPAAGAGLGLLSLTAAAGNEFTGVTVAAIVAASLWARRGGGPVQPVLHAGVLAAAVAGTLVQVLAPGTAERAAAAGSGDALGALLWGPLFFLNYLVLRVDAPGVLGWLLLAGLITAWHDRRYGRPHPPRPELVWLPLAVFVLSGIAAFAAGFYGIGSMLPARAQNQVHLLGFFALTLAVAAFVRSRPDLLRAWRRRLPRATPRRLAVVAVVLILASPQTIRAAYELVAEAPAYAAVQEDRIAHLAAAAGEAGMRPVAVAPLPARPRHLHMEDLRPDPGHWVNRCMARYYGIDAVVVAAPH